MSRFSIKKKISSLLEIADSTIQIPPFPEETPGLDATTLARDLVNPGNRKSYIDLSTPVITTAQTDPTKELFPESLPPSATPIVIGYVQLGLSQDSLRKNIQDFLTSTIILTLVIALIGVIATILLTQRIASPIRALSPRHPRNCRGKLRSGSRDNKRMMKSTISPLPSIRCWHAYARHA